MAPLPRLPYIRGGRDPVVSSSAQGSGVHETGKGFWGWGKPEARAPASRDEYILHEKIALPLGPRVLSPPKKREDKDHRLLASASAPDVGHDPRSDKTLPRGTTPEPRKPPSRQGTKPAASGAKPSEPRVDRTPATKPPPPDNARQVSSAEPSEPPARPGANTAASAAKPTELGPDRPAAKAAPATKPRPDRTQHKDRPRAPASLTLHRKMQTSGPQKTPEARQILGTDNVEENILDYMSKGEEMRQSQQTPLKMEDSAKSSGQLVPKTLDGQLAPKTPDGREGWCLTGTDVMPRAEVSGRPATSAAPERPSLSPGPSGRAMRAVSPRQEASWRSPEKVAGREYGTYYEFMMADMMGQRSVAKEQRHFDYTFKTSCSWDQGEEALNTHEMAEATKYHRLFYTWSMKPLDPSEAMQRDLNVFRQFQAAGEVALESFAAWVSSIRPKAVHDLKPLCVLLQGALRAVLDDKFAFFSQEMEDLKRQLAAARQLIAELEGEVSKLTQKLAGAVARGSMAGATSNLRGRKQKDAEASNHDNCVPRAQYDADLAACKADAAEALAAKQRELDQFKALIKEAHKGQVETDKALVNANAKLRKMTEVSTKQAKELRATTLGAGCPRCKGFDLCDASGCARCRGRELNDAGADALAGLEILFGEQGSWQFVSSHDEAREMMALANDYIKRTFFYDCEITRITMDDEDADGDRELEEDEDEASYDGSVFEVVRTFRDPKVRPTGYFLSHAEGTLNYEAARTRLTQNNHAEDAFFSPINIARDPDDPLGEVWGVIEGFPCTGALNKQALGLYATGMARIFRRLKLQDEEALLAISSNVGAKDKWLKIRSAMRSGLLRNMGKGGRGNDSGGAQGAEAAPRDPHELDMEALQLSQDELRELNEARIQIDRLFAGEQMRNAMMQVKSYRKPPVVVSDVIMALFTCLGHTAFWEDNTDASGANGEPIAEDDVRMVAGDRRDAVWKATQQRFKIEQTLKSMRTHDPANNLPLGPYAEVRRDEKTGQDWNLTRMKNMTVDKILSQVDRSAATRASVAVGLCREWIYVTRRITIVLENQKDLKHKLNMSGMSALSPTSPVNLNLRMPGYRG